MIRKYHNHTLQTNPWHLEEEPQNIYSNKTSGRHKSKAISSLFPLKMIAKLERTQSNAQQNKDDPSFEQIVSQIYQIALQLNKANSFDTEAIFMHLDLSITNGIVHLKCMINGMIFFLK